MRWTAKRKGAVIAYGYEQSGLGFFCTVTSRYEYDGLRPGYDGVPGILRLLVDTGVATEEAVAEAARLLPHVTTADDIKDPDARFVATVILNLRGAASD